MAKRLFPESSQALRKLAAGAAATFTVLGLAALPLGIGWKGLLLLVTLSSFAVIAWMSLLDAAERAVARKWLGLGNLP